MKRPKTTFYVNRWSGAKPDCREIKGASTVGVEIDTGTGVLAVELDVREGRPEVRTRWGQILLRPMAANVVALDVLDYQGARTRIDGDEMPGLDREIARGALDVLRELAIGIRAGTATKLAADRRKTANDILDAITRIGRVL